MRKVVSILVIIAFLFNISGYYIIFSLIQREIKSDFRSYLKYNFNKEDVIILNIPNSEINGKNSEFRWTEKDEFLYKGKMYDVVKSEQHNNTSVFYCINDTKEERLLAIYESSIKNYHESNRPLNEKSITLCKQIIKDATIKSLLNQNKNLPSQNIETSNIFSVKKGIKDNPFVPPKS